MTGATLEPSARHDAMLHAGAATALGAVPIRISQATGLPLEAMPTLLGAGRIQGRLSQKLLGNSKSAWRAVPDGFFAPQHILDRAVWYAGAAFSAEALSMLLTRAARAPVAAWLPEGAWHFALQERKDGQLRCQRDAMVRETVGADGGAAAKAWLDGAVPADAARLALRWDCPPCLESRPAPPQVLAALFERAIAAAHSTNRGGVDD